MVRPTSVAARDDARRAALLNELIPLFHAEGFLAFSLEDLARRLGCSKSTLYVVAASKEQIIQATVRESFRRSTEAVERRVAAEPDSGRRISVYLDAIAEELAPAGPTYFADLDAYEPARDVYRTNVRLAAQRVKELVEASGRRRLEPRFVGAVAGLVLEAIHRGAVEADTGLDDAAAFHQLAVLVDHATRGDASD
ncbi:TetR/AcrR family transcriptional regulator [Aeromicrobium sp. 50.2.37]|uniref:TetR/AcrR family transcriptional regulator n=1 Tax=Aeromicrobium sp. 50.2.37 TaxID=2969305 RepID=UPI0021503872|nr:TetR/AcrR family transcriptional regulator [Aeromicrobium sp. 50.2.37]MCR4514403.1 TetR/AcrR family transcriptional regulator [Aeromicrobium sp. 50.2.37]